MDLFLSWSGERSRNLANIFYTWVSNVMPTLKVYYSDKEILPGEVWANSVGKNLEELSMGVFFVVEENIDSPWLNFEAGAISKRIGDSKVIPLLHDLNPGQISGPMSQFQAKKIGKQELLDVLTVINNSLDDQRRISKDKLDKIFEKWYSDFEESYANFMKENPNLIHKSPESSTGVLDQKDQLEEILLIVRGLQRTANDRNLLNEHYHNIAYSKNSSKKDIQKREFINAYNTLRNDLNRRPTIEELSAELQCSESAIKEFLNLYKK